MATITMGGDKLPLQIIASGKTRPTLRSLGDVGLQTADFTLKGWQALETFVRYVHWLGQFAPAPARQ
jgi:hypothetical protein